MKKRILTFLLAASMILLTGCHSSNNSTPTGGNPDSSKEELTKLTLNEVAHSIFYAPMYVAIEKDYFRQEGIELELVTGFGADKTMTAVLSGEADIGFMGSEASIYTYNEGASDFVVNFAQLTQRAGNFLVAREERPDFEWTDLKGSTVLGGRKGGMPEMVFEYILKQHGMDPKTDLNIVQNIDFGSTAAAFSEGQADYTVEFEPGATSLETGQKGYVVASLGTDSGYIPYTAFSARKSYIQTHSPEEIAKIIEPQFPETDLSTITTIVSRYYEQDSWKENLIFERDSFELLQDILESAGELKVRAPYEKLVTTDFAENAGQN